MCPGKKPLKILVTGGTGFVGSHLLDFLVNSKETTDGNIEIFATRRYHLSRRDKVEHLENKVEWVDCDITDSVSVNDLIKKVLPDQIYHMAAESFVSPSWSLPHRYMDVNYNGTVNMLEAIRNYAPKCKILLPGSGEEYGEVAFENLPINSETPLKPVNPYAVTKIAQDLIGYVYFKSFGTQVIRLRTFNHEGPRRERYFGIASYCYQIARIEAGIQDPIIEVGHLDDQRNFTHVIDIIRAYEIAMNQLPPGDLYIVGSDSDKNSATFKQVLDTLIMKSSYKNRIEVRQVDKFTRPTAVPYLVGDISKFKNLTNWEITYSLDQILDDVLNYWRNRVKVHPYI